MDGAPDLRQLQCFLAAAERLHFTQAAAALGISQPTLSLAIRQLERDLGAPLFDRVGRSVQLTAAGALFRERAAPILQAVADARQAVADLEGVRTGRLRVGVTHIFATSLMPGVLADFHGRYPGVTVAVEKLTSRAVEAALLAGRLDVGVTFAPPAAAELLPEKLFDERIVLAVPRGHRLARDAGPAPFAALADLPLALTTPEFATRQLLDATAAAARVRLRVALEFNDIDLLLMTLARLPPKADLATVLARRAVRGHAAAVVLRPIVSPALTRTAYLLWHRDRHRPQAARVLADMIRSGGKDWTADR